MFRVTNTLISRYVINPNGVEISRNRDQNQGFQLKNLTEKMNFAPITHVLLKVFQVFQIGNHNEISLENGFMVEPNSKSEKLICACCDMLNTIMDLIDSLEYANLDQ